MNSDKPREECGIFGIYDPHGNGDIAANVYFGLMALQHRGQESCGIAVNNDRDITYRKGLGLVNEVFNPSFFEELKGDMAIGHVRYSTHGDGRAENAQPLVLNYIKGIFAVAHNGNILNYDELKEEYSQSGSIFQTTIDSEIIAYTIAKERVHSRSVEEAVSFAMKKLKGAYSLVVMSPQKVIAARDPWGFRPLCVGKTKNGAYVFASESCALDAVDATLVRDVLPGEVVMIKRGKDELISDTTNCNKYKSTMCIFEYIYFARPDSIIGGQFVQEARRRAGGYLAKQAPVPADIVIGVPDSGISAAKGYSTESGIPLEEGFVKNRYIARTFIRPTQASRESAVRVKLNPLRERIAGKRVVMVDDSIVRGTTCKRIVNLLKKAGAAEVHVRICAPPFLNPCYFGTDIPSEKELIAHQYTLDETRRYINADSLEYLSLENLPKIAPDAKTDFCTACFSNDYPVS